MMKIKLLKLLLWVIKDFMESCKKKKDYTQKKILMMNGILLGELEGEFADMDGWNAKADAETMLNGLGITSRFS